MIINIRTPNGIECVKGEQHGAYSIHKNKTGFYSVSVDGWLIVECRRRRDARKIVEIIRAHVPDKLAMTCRESNRVQNEIAWARAVAITQLY
jgi:hypothetical protein